MTGSGSRTWGGNDTHKREENARGTELYPSILGQSRVRRPQPVSSDHAIRPRAAKSDSRYQT